ncbi:hypothetical protein APHAL10511_003668 [Amanita phalloides]|nr:hypothetical protein APHAL10511_003668 [Amanita phalloides]
MMFLPNKMAHSTTATSSYVLNKYSRSYPASAHTYADWQHFTNPEIRLVLDVERSSNSDLRGVRLRVVWNMKDGDSQQPQVVFEDIDLLSFSSLASDNSLNRQQQLPLKAAYRDNLVGIRYLHPKESVNAAPTFRRFQVTFSSVTIATEFINTICTVCPCKFTPSGISNQNMDPPQIPPRAQPTTLAIDNAIPASMFRYSTASALSLSSPQIPSSSQQERDYSQFTSSPATVDMEKSSRISHSQGTVREHEVAWTPEFGNHSIPAEQSSKFYLPWSQLSSQDVDRTSRLTQGDNEHKRGTSSTETGDTFFSALQEATQLYDLSPTILEQLIAKVVREEGFPRLLESLAKLWRLKDLINVRMPD